MGRDVVGRGESWLFVYTTRHLSKSDKVRFYYALKGRDGKSGVVKKYVQEQLAKTVLLVPQKFEHEIEEFLAVWKCSYKKKKVYLEKA